MSNSKSLNTCSWCTCWPGHNHYLTCTDQPRGSERCLGDAQDCLGCTLEETEVRRQQKDRSQRRSGYEYERGLVCTQ